ncbi:fimbrial isopeptide formation D2 family protein [Leucobacter luti]|uniref:Fimbrial isopeptide formation D2 family protein n=2 Tax=Leucobacter luti TaxID=340320 RepID=A0A4Q7TWQ4_9MICO|nr:isopeptide-forming domain-containing fimbrial protein [Leucobacter luti]RZT64610.1 fimbrial isopeptide formation D2 family protein [Leucobacter luti]
MATYKKTRGMIAAAGAVALGFGGLMFATIPANAVPVDGPVDATKTGSLTIHKFEYPADGNQNPSGTGTNPTGPIGDVVFTVCKIDNITSLGDTSNAGWAQVKGLNALSTPPLTGTVAGVDSSTTFPVSGCQTVTSAASGSTPTLSGLAVGAYLVTETSAPAGVVKGDPFIVTLPTPADTAAGATNTGRWEYDVNVYPKNLKSTAPTKTIHDQPNNGVVLGQDIDYTISQVVPALPSGQSYTKFVVTDALDAKLDLKSGSVVVTYDGGTLTEGTDYTLDTTGDVIVVTLLATVPGTPPAPNSIPIEAGKTLTVDFTATANATGEIPNTAVVNINDLDFDGDGTPGTPTTEVKTRWGNLLGEKINADDTMKLGGAKFEVYMTADTDGTCAAATTADLAGLSSVTTVTSAAMGSIAIPGLWVGDTNDNVTNRCYILKEIEAPAGYVLPTGDAALHSVNVTVGTVSTATFDVRNDQQLVPGLPLTGGDGERMLLVVGGALLILGAVGVALRLNRRREITASA